MSTSILTDIIEQARRVNIESLAERYSQLRKVSSREWAGPCPKCGGDDRLHVKEDGWFCRQCKPIDPVHGWHDAIDFMRFVSGCTFQEAVAQLTGEALPTATQRQPERKQVEQSIVSDPIWQRRATKMLERAQERLFGPDGAPGREYLESRGLESQTWLQFGLGYRSDVSIPGTEGKEKAPAIAMPWFSYGKLTAIRYRFLVVQNGEKQTAEGGSKFAGRLFGGRGLPEWVRPADSDGKFERMCDLVICEGEINCMSIWQVAGETNLHALSMGSESAKLTDMMIAHAARYRNVIVWADKPEVAHHLQEVLSAAHSITSPGGKDANDLLREGSLGAVLAMTRSRVCKNDSQREGVLWDLWDANRGCLGDAGTKQAIRHIADQLGREAVAA